MGTNDQFLNLEEDFERIEAGIGVKRNANGDIVKNFCFS